MMRSHSSRAVHGAIDAPLETQRPFGPAFTAAMKASLTSTDRLNMVSRPGVRLASMKLLDVGMVARQRRHHRAAPATGAHDGAAHRVPHFHERDRAGGVRAHAAHCRALGPQGGEIVADAAALLQRQRRFAQVREDPIHRVRDRAHHEAVEERDVPLRAGAGENAARRQELVAGQRAREFRRPCRALLRRFGPAPRPAPRGRACPPAPDRRACRRRSSAGISCPRSGGKYRSWGVPPPGTERPWKMVFCRPEVKLCSCNVPKAVGVAEIVPTCDLERRWRQTHWMLRITGRFSR